MIKLLDKVADYCVGMDFEKAKGKITKAGAEVRLVEVDGRALMVTADFNEKRINIVLYQGKVMEAYVG